MATAPREIVASREDGTIVVLDANDGTVRRELAIRDAEPFAPQLTVSPDGEFVYYDAGNAADGLPELVRVPVAGGEPERIDDGALPVLSPDGTPLAYGTYEPTAAGEAPVNALGLLDVTTGDRTFRAAAGVNLLRSPRPYAWVDSSQLLAAGPTTTVDSRWGEGASSALVEVDAESPLDDEVVATVDVGFRSVAPAVIGGVLGAVLPPGGGVDLLLQEDPTEPATTDLGHVDAPAFPTDVTEDRDQVLFVGFEGADREAVFSSEGTGGTATKYLGVLDAGGEIRRPGGDYTWACWIPA